eukprot:6203617-Amphidinium_carterae.1
MSQMVQRQWPIVFLAMPAIFSCLEARSTTRAVSSATADLVHNPSKRIPTLSTLHLLGHTLITQDSIERFL